MQLDGIVTASFFAYTTNLTETAMPGMKSLSPAPRSTAICEAKDPGDAGTGAVCNTRAGHLRSDWKANRAEPCNPGLNQVASFSSTLTRTALGRGFTTVISV